MALLDKTVLIDLGRGAHAREHVRARAAVQAVLADGEALFTSRINEAEFRVGPELVEARERELARVERILAGVVILEFTGEAAQRYAVIKAIAAKRGWPIGDCDALVASVALANGLPLLTRNARHFINIPGLTVKSY